MSKTFGWISAGGLWSVLGVVSLCGWLTACSCGEDNKGSDCSKPSECNAGYDCIAGRCALPSDSGMCVDKDGDGYGSGCPGGGDCDDNDPKRGGPVVCGLSDRSCDGTGAQLPVLCGSLCSQQCTATQYPRETGGWNVTGDNSSGVSIDQDGALTLTSTSEQKFYLWAANTGEETVSKLDSRTGVELARYPSVAPPNPTTAWPAWGKIACNYGGNAAMNIPPQGNCPSRTAVDQDLNAYVANRAFGRQGTVTKYIGDTTKCTEHNGVAGIQTSKDCNGNGIIEFDYVQAGDNAACKNGEREFYSGANGVPVDDCVAWTSAVGPAWGGAPRALAIGSLSPDGAGDVWVGLFFASTAVQLNNTNGQIVRELPIGGFNPYGAVADRRGYVWFAHRGGGRADVLGALNTFTGEFEGAPGFNAYCPAAPGQAPPFGVPYGITLDNDGNVYFAFHCDNPYTTEIVRYDPPEPPNSPYGEDTLSESERWKRVTIKDASGKPFYGYTRGVAVDDQYVWIADSHKVPLDANGKPDTAKVTGDNTRVFQLNRETLDTVNAFGNIGCAGPVGVGISLDADKGVWAICADGHATRYDRKGTGVGTNGVNNGWVSHPIGLVPYTYSDFMGYTLNLNAVAEGRHALVLPGCPKGATTWLGLTFPGALIPDANSLQVRVKSAATAAELNLKDTTGWTGPFGVDPTRKTVNLTAAPGPVGGNAFLGVEIKFKKSPNGAVPRVYAIDTVTSCSTNEPI